MQLAVVRWIDTVSAGDEWVEETETPCAVTTVGILKKETENYMTIVLSETEDGLMRGYASIPKSCIVFSVIKELDA